MFKKIEAAGFEECRFDTGEVILNYVVGPNNGLPLVLIPAQMGTWESYQKVLPSLSRKFLVYAVDVRGHGKSGWTTGDYCWESVGRDLSAFLERVVGRPAIVSGNSSGGLIALWLAANKPELVSGIVLEDAPIFSVEMPRFRDRDRFVYEGIKRTVEAIENPEDRDLADYFRVQELPLKNGRMRRVPGWFVSIMSAIIRRHQPSELGQPVDVPYFPLTLRLLIKSLSTFDPDFARAFIDGRFYEGLDHTKALKKVRCPMLVLHADWFRHPKYGLVGAMDDTDAARVRELVPHSQYTKVPANHVIHLFKPNEFVWEVGDFAASVALSHPA